MIVVSIIGKHEKQFSILPMIDGAWRQWLR